MTAEIDVESLADTLVAGRQQRIAEDVARWRNWLATSLDETLALTDAQLGARAALVQWLFPTGIRSQIDRSAPRRGRVAMRAAAAADPSLREAIGRAFDRYMPVLGLQESSGVLRWAAGPQPWAMARYRDWRSTGSSGARTRPG